ncbi:tetratricopeptide repeat protein [Pararhizobium haloflavum]|uniref:tetratricopeptide repeat protein n=1 Tax=Pararhizobium haloflavum TaxID=2037914 RepID=UPI001FE1F326|nr:tetratricopeptide repeat protein [Pararhizobium haloflavum]
MIIALAISATLSACANTSQITTGSIPEDRKPVASMSFSEIEAASRRVGAAYESRPDDKSIGMSYASILRMSGDHDQALAVMRQMAIHHPRDHDVLAAYGKAQAAAGELQQGLDTIRRAQTPDRPDWALLSAEGAILDQMEQPEEARALYRKALDIKPNEPSVLSNLGMSYLLQGDLKSAETHMRSAVEQPEADSRMRQNLALVVGLQGRFEEAERIAGAELDPAEASANVDYLRTMLSQQNAWSQLSKDDAGATN